MEMTATDPVFIKSEKQEAAEPPQNVSKFVADALEAKSRGNSASFNQMLKGLQSSLDTSSISLLVWFRGISQNISLLSQQHESLVVSITSGFNFGTANDELLVSFTDLMLNLLSGHSYFISHCTKCLVKNLYPIPKKESLSPRDPKKPETIYDRAVSERVHNHVHQTIQSLLSIIPSASGALFAALQHQFPFFKTKDAETHKVFLANILQIVTYFPALRDRVLELSLDKMIQLDVHIKLEDLPDEEDELVFEVEMETPEVADKMDEMMGVMFSFIDDTISKGFAPELWTTILKLFDSKVLTTHKSKYTQFLVFYLSREDPNFAIQFLDYLKQRLFDSKNHTLTRQTCAAYVGSFISRASFLGIEPIRDALREMVKWGLSYVDCSPTKTSLDAELHGLFYSVCQSIFYCVCFHHETLFSGAAGREFLTELEFERLATCKLVPLKFCLPAIVTELDRICGLLGLVTVCEGIEQSKSLAIPTRSVLGSANQLDSFFPFDPYLLRKSSKKINPIYRQWTSPQAPVQETEAGGENSDEESPSSSLGSDLKSMSITPTGRSDLLFHWRNRSSSSVSMTETNSK